MQTVLGRQRACDQRHVADEIRLQNRAETLNAFRKKNAVDTVLRVGVLVAHVQIAARGGILGHTRRARSTGVFSPCGSETITSRFI